jgi:predicted RNase H-like nuclease (RuvC/YqgF family)
MDDNQPQPVITDNLVGEGKTVEFTTEQQTLFSLEELTVKTTTTIDSLKDQLKTAKEMLDDALMADQVFKNQVEDLKESQKAKKVVETQALRRPDIAVLAEKVKEIRGDLKEKKESQSDYALEFSRLSGASEIQIEGATYEIRKVAKLVKRVQ